MKTKTITTMIALAAILIAGNVQAASGQKPADTSGKQPQVQAENQVQVQTANQGEETQVQTRTTEQVQAGEAATPSGAGVKAQERATQQLMDEGGNGPEAKNQNKNQGEADGTQAQQRKNDMSGSGQQNRSRVANAVHEMLQVADRSGGIGEQIRTIAQSQNQNQEKLDISLKKVQSRNKLARFFFGPNYKEIANAEDTIKANKAQVQELNQIMDQLSNESDQQKLREQIQVLEQANAEVESTIKDSQSGFSLLGWMFKILAK